MAYATMLTIATGNKVSMNYQSQDVSVSLTYQLERDDTDLMALVERKAGEVERAHRRAWQCIRDQRLADQAASNGTSAANGASDANGTTSAGSAHGTGANGVSANHSHTNGVASPEASVAARTPRPARTGAKGTAETQSQPDTTPDVTDTGPTTIVNANAVIPADRQPTQRTAAGIPSQRPITKTQIGAIGSLSARLGLSEEELSRRTDIRYGKRLIEELTELQGTSLILELQRNAPVIAATRPDATTVQTNGSDEQLHQEEPQGGNGHGRKTRRTAARS